MNSSKLNLFSWKEEPDPVWTPGSGLKRWSFCYLSNFTETKSKECFKYIAFFHSFNQQRMRGKNILKKKYCKFFWTKYLCHLFEANFKLIFLFCCITTKRKVKDVFPLSRVEFVLTSNCFVTKKGDNKTSASNRGNSIFYLSNLNIYIFFFFYFFPL